jgi:hypothetical protein
MTKILRTAALLGAAGLLAACTDPYGNPNTVATGATVGALTGAAAGQLAGGDTRSTAAGAAAGMAAGIATGAIVEGQATR